MGYKKGPPEESSSTVYIFSAKSIQKLLNVHYVDTWLIVLNLEMSSNNDETPKIALYHLKRFLWLEMYICMKRHFPSDICEDQITVHE